MIKNTRLGIRRFLEYEIWKAMKQRCFNKSNKDYSLYGARGISVCDEWAKSFESFLEDAGRRPSSQHSLDRRKNNGNYEPGNIRWATPTEQARNRRNTYRFTFNGLTLTIEEWSERPEVKRIGISYLTLRNRLKNYKWPIERAITTAVLAPEISEKCRAAFLEKAPKISFGGITDTLRGWSSRVGIDICTLQKRFQMGWSVKRTLTQSLEVHRASAR